VDAIPLYQVKRRLCGIGNNGESVLVLQEADEVFNLLSTVKIHVYF